MPEKLPPLAPQLADIPKLFRRTREAAGLKQEDVVAAVPGLTQSTYSRFELGQADLDVTVIFNIKDFLDKHSRRKVGGGLVSLQSLAGLPSAPSHLKLTEQIAWEMESEAWRKEAREIDRQSDIEVYAGLKRLLDDVRAKHRSLEAEVASLKADKGKPELRAEDAVKRLLEVLAEVGSLKADKGKREWTELKRLLDDVRAKVLEAEVGSLKPSTQKEKQGR